jgi:hypothetical protein
VRVEPQHRDPPVPGREAADSANVRAAAASEDERSSRKGGGDADTTPGAAALSERVGMRVVRRRACWERSA